MSFPSVRVAGECHDGSCAIDCKQKESLCEPLLREEGPAQARLRAEPLWLCVDG